MGEASWTGVFGEKLWGHPLKGTCQEKKVFRKQEKALLFTSVFLGRTMRLREWAALWLVGAAAYLIDSFALDPRYSHALRKSPFFSY